MAEEWNRSFARRTYRCPRTGAPRSTDRHQLAAAATEVEKTCRFDRAAVTATFPSLHPASASTGVVDFARDVDRAAYVVEGPDAARGIERARRD